MNEKRINQQMRNFERALNSYSYREPLSRFLTKYYKENKQMGSSDRRTTSRLCYNFFRIGAFAAHLPTHERVVLAEYLCEQESALVAFFRPDLLSTIGEDLNTKVSALQADIRAFFPYVDGLSEGVEQNAFLLSQLRQPNLFIRAKRGKEKQVEAELNKWEIDFVRLSEQTFAMTNGTRLQNLSQIEGYFEVQDLNSQRTIEFMNAGTGETWWDACAGSGGKSLMFLDKFPHTKLLVSDARLSILRNLNERFEKAGINSNYTQKIIDLTGDVSTLLGERTFDGIILDVPCSGSGTWGRTPEMKVQFDKKNLDAFATLQKRITAQVLPYLKAGKILTYITCSVYRAENEDVVRYTADKHNLKIERMQILPGYSERADSMFVACLRKN